MPLPRSTRTSPGCVPGGSSSSTGPSSVSTATVAPSAACDDRQVDLREDVVALAHEPRVGLHAHEHVDVAGAAAERAGVALAGDADALAVVDAGRHLDLRARARSSVRPAPSHAWHGCSIDDAAAAAVRARLRADELAEDAARDLLQVAAAVAARAARRLRARLDAVAAADRAGDRELERHAATVIPRAASTRSISISGADVGAALRRPPDARAAEEVVAEERGEEVAEPADVEVGRLEAAASAGRRGRSGRRARASRSSRAPRTPR